VVIDANRISGTVQTHFARLTDGSIAYDPHLQSAGWHLPIKILEKICAYLHEKPDPPMQESRRTT
jgi:hypothetical protein